MPSDQSTPTSTLRGTEKSDNKYKKFEFDRCLRQYDIIPTNIWKTMLVRKLDYFVCNDLKKETPVKRSFFEETTFQYNQDSIIQAGTLLKKLKMSDNELSLNGGL